MTLYVMTESHGEVESGFYAVFTQFCRLGDYSFTTREFCDFLCYIADNPEVREARIKSYDLGKFQQRLEEHRRYLVDVMSNVECEHEIEKGICAVQGEAPADDMTDLSGETETLNIQINSGCDRINIGDYELSAEHFGGMSFYIARGGVCGGVEPAPEFAVITMNSIRTSKHGIYRKLQKDLAQLIM